MFSSYNCGVFSQMQSELPFWDGRSSNLFVALVAPPSQLLSVLQAAETKKTKQMRGEKNRKLSEKAAGGTT